MLRMMLRMAVLVGALAALGGCGNGVGNDGAVVGGSCLTSAQCDNDSQCLTGTSYPNGYCAKSCTAPTDCPDGSTCVDATGYGATCLLTCTAGADCRTGDGYDCVELPAHGSTTTTAMVCAMP